jgi:hypothetical protein
MMENFTMAELGVFIGILGGVLTTLLLTIQKSKCETIDLRRCMCSRKITTQEKTPIAEPLPEVPEPEPEPEPEP